MAFIPCSLSAQVGVVDYQGNTEIFDRVVSSLSFFSLSLFFVPLSQTHTDTHLMHVGRCWPWTPTQHCRSSLTLPSWKDSCSGNACAHVATLLVCVREGQFTRLVCHAAYLACVHPLHFILHDSAGSCSLKTKIEPSSRARCSLHAARLTLSCLPELAWCINPSSVARCTPTRACCQIR